MHVLVTGILVVTAAGPSVNTRACAHRGDSKCAPENTVPAFISAVRKGAHQIELDLYLSKDGKLVVIHDTTVDRTTNGTGKVTDLTFDELRALDAGSWFDGKFAGTQIPTFREALEVIPQHILCNVHLKNAPGVAEAATHVLVEMDRLDHCFLACTRTQAAAARAIAPTVKICNMEGQRGGDQVDYIKATLDVKAEYIQFAGVPQELLTDVVDKAHDHNVTVNYFGASREPDIRALILGGVDYILTDDLDTCLSVLVAYGVKPAQPPSEHTGAP
jgi:glycerophosphoryl diester phosphodiesterase